MNIKHILGVSAALLVLAAGGVAADDVGVTDDAGNARLLLQAGREEIIRVEMRLSSSEDAEFWPVYDKYQSDLTLVRNRHAMLLADYIQAYRSGTVSAEFAEKLVDDFLEIQGDIL
jgi:hypothetical protein